MIHTVKGFSIVNEAELDFFLEVPCFFYDPADVGNLISGSSAFSNSSLYIWKFLVHALLKYSLKDFEHNFTNVWNQHSCIIVLTFFGIVFSLRWERKLTFTSPLSTAEFSNLLAYWAQNLNYIIF